MTNDTTPAPIGEDALIDELEYAILGIPMARNFDRVRAAKAALRAALASAAQPADFDADRAMRAQAAPTTDSYVQPVPDKCDRITWRGSYYHLPLKASQQPAPAPLIARSLAEWHEDDGCVAWWAWNGREWAGEPAWIGNPNCEDWPGYHTHWTPHPEQPAQP